MMTFAQKLKSAMKDLGLKQIDVSNLTGKPKSTISQYISGKNVPPEKVQRKIAVALGLNADYFEIDIPVIKLLKKGDYVIPQLSVEQAARIMRLDVLTVQKGLQQKKFTWGYAIKTSSKWRYFINANAFAAIEKIEIPQDMIM